MVVTRGGGGRREDEEGKRGQINDGRKLNFGW